MNERQKRFFLIYWHVIYLLEGTIKRSVFQGSVPSIYERQSSSGSQRHSDYAKSISPEAVLQYKILGVPEER
jgi:hypothetical protein